MSIQKLPSYLFIVLLFAGMGCTNLEEISSSSAEESPLKVVINVATRNPSDTYVEYWKADIDIKDKSFSVRSLNKIDHEIILIGLEAESNYNYFVYASRKGKETKSEIYSFTTGSLPEHIPEFDLVADSGNTFDGYIMLRKMDFPGTQLIIDNMGKVRWFQVSDTSVFRPFSLTSRDSYLALRGRDEIVEMDLRGDTLLNLHYGESGFNRYLHHEIFKDEKDQIVALTKEFKTFDLSRFGGNKMDTVSGDGILILDSLGNKIWSWNLFDVMDPMPSLELEKSKNDWSHANALSKDKDGNFLISFRNFNQIWKVDAADGHIIWKLGENGNFELKESEYFKYQHAVHINPMGNVMIFDNIYKDLNTSRAIAFKIGKLNKRAWSTMTVNLPDSLYSFKQGSVFFIDEEKLLFCSSIPKKIAITNTKGEILWQVSSDQSFYRAIYIEDEDIFSK